MNRITPFFLGTVMGLACLVWPGSGDKHLLAQGDLKKKDADRLLVTIWPKTTCVQVEKYFDVHLRVVNATDKTQSFQIMCGSWFDHWKANNTRIWLASWDCTKNFPKTIKLEPGEAYEESLQVQVGDGAPLVTTSFQMGFTPLGEKKTYWSNKVVLGIKPGKRKE